MFAICWIAMDLKSGPTMIGQKGDLKSGASPFNVDLKSGSIHTMNLKSGIPHGFCPPVLSGIVTLVS